MFEIKKMPGSENYYSINLEGKLISHASYNEDYVLYMEDFGKFDMDKIASMNLAEFPNYFSLNIEARKPVAGVFYLVWICKKDDQVKIKLVDYLYYSSKWMAWNSYAFIRAATRVLGKNGHFSMDDEDEPNGEPPSICFKFTFPAEGTVGNMMKKCEEQCREMIRETELYLLKQVEERINNHN